jgi:hypothetical protein
MTKRRNLSGELDIPDRLSMPGSPARHRHRNTTRSLSGMRRFDDEDLTGAEFRECDLSRTRLIGVVMQDAEIDGLVTNLTINGVEVMSYVEAELDRRHPVRLLIRSDEPADLRRAWRQLRDDWATTAERVRSMPEGSEHHGVDGEWSMVETLRHLVFVHDSWFRRCVLGLSEPFTPMGLASPFVPNQEEQGLDRSARPSLDEVLVVRERQASQIEAWLAQVSPEQLAQSAPVPMATGGPRTPEGGGCGDASAPYSTRSGPTTVSVYATSTSCQTSQALKRQAAASSGCWIQAVASL